MPTVFERVNKLGLAHSNHILQMLGEEVKLQLPYAELLKIKEKQGNEVFYVNDYSPALTQEIDRIILNWVNKRSANEYFRRYQWWYNYKVNR